MPRAFGGLAAGKRQQVPDDFRRAFRLGQNPRYVFVQLFVARIHLRPRGQFLVHELRIADDARQGLFSSCATPATS